MINYGIIIYNTHILPDFACDLELTKNNNDLRNCVIVTPYNLHLTSKNKDYVLLKGTHFIPNTYCFDELSCNVIDPSVQIYNNSIPNDLFISDLLLHFPLIFPNILSIDKKYMINYNGIIDTIDSYNLSNVENNNYSQFVKYENIIKSVYYYPNELKILENVPLENTETNINIISPFINHILINPHVINLIKTCEKIQPDRLKICVNYTNYYHLKKYLYERYNLTIKEYIPNNVYIKKNENDIKNDIDTYFNKLKILENKNQLFFTHFEYF